jgi:crotonobetainyl-CoA:carnitine CoA-transferase CaiB-like acyl-CoA transferase
VHGASQAGFLSPYRVLDLTDQRGLLAGCMLGKLGAEVIQVEPPNGSPARQEAPFATDAPSGENSLYWSAFASFKRGITCDIERPEGRELLLRLVEKADFLIESANPGVMAKLGLDYETLRRANPAIICVSITPFGAAGPKSAYVDSDLIVWASAGPLHPNRDQSGVPTRISVPQAYLHGAADAATGALIALFARHRNRLGQHVQVSSQRSASLATLSVTLAAAVGHSHYQFPADQQPKKKSLDLSGSGARTRRSKWQVKDGVLELHLGLGPAAGGSANKLFAWMREQGALPKEFWDWDWVTLPARLQNEEISEEHMDAARAAVGSFLAPFTKSYLMDAALKRGILMAPAMTIKDLTQSEHLRSRNFFDVTAENGRMRTLPGPFAFGCPQGFVRTRPAPALGEHNREVYGSLLGLPANQLEHLAAAGVI